MPPGPPKRTPAYICTVYTHILYTIHNLLFLTWTPSITGQLIMTNERGGGEIKTNSMYTSYFRVTGILWPQGA